MLSQKLFEIAEEGNLQKVEEAFTADKARFVKKAIRRAKKAMYFKAAATLTKYLQSLGVRVDTKQKEADLSKYPAHLKVILETGDPEVDAMVSGTINRIGVISSRDKTPKGETLVCNLKADDAKRLMERAKDTAGITIEKLAKK